MRFRDYRDRETRSRWIEAQLSRHEELDEGLAAWLERTRDRSLLEVRRVRAGGPGVRGAADAEPLALLYDVTGLVTLPELLRADAVSRQQYEAMLFSVADLASALESAPCSLAAADFRPQHVFALGDGALRFIVVPVVRRPRLLKPPDARDLLHHLATGRALRFISDEDMRRAERLVRLLDSMRSFDSAAYLDFLEAEYGVRTGARQQVRPRRERADTASAGARAAAEPQAPAAAGAGAAVAGGAGRGGAVPREVPRTMLRGSLSQGACAWDDTWGGAGEAAGGLCGEGSAEADGGAPTDADAGDGRFSATGPGGMGLEVPSDFDAPWATGDLGNTTPGSFGDMGDADDVPTGSASAPGQAGGAGPAFWLVRESTGERYPLDEGVEDVIGRSSACDVQVLGNLGISRMHASVVCGDRGVEIFDLGSENGVVLRSGLLPVNDHAMVAVGERFMLADELFHVERGEGA